LGVSLRTIGHWETGRARPTFAAFKLLRVLRHGEFADPAWTGFRIVRGRFVTPENHSFEPGEVSWLSLLVRRAAAFSELRQQRDAACVAAAPAVGSGLSVVGAMPASVVSLPTIRIQEWTFSPEWPVARRARVGFGPGSNTGLKAARSWVGGAP